MEIEYTDIAIDYWTPLYIYNLDTLENNCKFFSDLLKNTRGQIYFAVMCNNLDEILKIIKNAWFGVQINSEYELNIVEKNNFPTSKISFTSTGISKNLLKILIDKDININLDSVEEVEKFCMLSSNKTFGIRVKIPNTIQIQWCQTTNHSTTSNVGIHVSDFEKIKNIAKTSGNRIVAIHWYFASNVKDIQAFRDFWKILFDNALQFPDLEYVNFGSGFWVKYMNEEQDLDIKEVIKYYSSLVEELSEKMGKEINFKIEPWRMLLNNVAYLLSTITNIKKLTEEKAEIAIDAWFWELIRPKLYNSYHEIENVEKMERKEKKYDVRWNTVLQNDFLAKDRWLSEVEEWEHLIIKNVGAYGAVMSSGFPWKPKIKWVVMSQWNISKIHE